MSPASHPEDVPTPRPQGPGHRASPDVRLWAVMQTRPRAEKVVAQWLEDEGVPHFLPLRRKRSHYGSRVRTRWLPLFSGYVFYDYEALEGPAVYGSRKVSRILVPHDPAEIARDLATLENAMAADPALERVRFGPAGSLVEVVGGPLRGYRGELIRRDGRTGIVVNVHFAHLAAATTIDEAFLRPLPPEEEHGEGGAIHAI